MAQQRNALNNSKKQLDDAVKRAQAIKSSAFELGQQIGDLRRVAFKTQLALNTGSILGSNSGRRCSRQRMTYSGWISSTPR